MQTLKKSCMTLSYIADTYGSKRKATMRANPLPHNNYTVGSVNRREVCTALVIECKDIPMTDLAKSQTMYSRYGYQRESQLITKQKCKSTNGFHERILSEYKGNETPYFGLGNSIGERSEYSL